jgi:hypothetical protein
MYDLVKLDDVVDSKDVWVMGGVLTGLSVLFGKEACGKSFLAVAWGVAVASGQDWFDNEVKQGPVVYIVGEGGLTQMGRRVRECIRHVEAPPDIPFYLIPTAVPLADEADPLPELCASIDATGEVPRLIVVDTVSRCFAGQNENQQDAMSRFVGRCDALKERYKDACVLAIHHENKGHELRGSTVLPAAADSIISMKRARTGDTRAITLAAEKLKDGDVEAFAPKKLTTHSVDCVDRDGLKIIDNLGGPTTTLVLDVVENPTNLDNALSAFMEVRDPSGARTVSLKSWREAAEEHMSFATLKRMVRQILRQPKVYEIVRPWKGQYVYLPETQKRLILDENWDNTEDQERIREYLHDREVEAAAERPELDMAEEYLLRRELAEEAGVDPDKI